MQVAIDDSLVSVVLLGHLDGAIGEQLLAAISEAMKSSPRRVDIDLRRVKSFTTEGADALVACRDLCGPVEDGLHYRTGRGASQKALLAAYAAEPATSADAEPARPMPPLR